MRSWLNTFLKTHPRAIQQLTSNKQTRSLSPKLGSFGSPMSKLLTSPKLGSIGNPMSELLASPKQGSIGDPLPKLLTFVAPKAYCALLLVSSRRLSPSGEILITLLSDEP